MARPGLPKKYAKMGFKRGWRAFKAAKRKRSSPKRRTSRRATNPKRRSTMRRRKTFNIPLIQSVAGIAMLGIASKGVSQKSALEHPVASIERAGENLLDNKDEVIKLGLGYPGCTIHCNRSVA